MGEFYQQEQFRSKSAEAIHGEEQSRGWSLWLHQMEEEGAWGHRPGPRKEFLKQ